jgi:hypothetical protein
VTPYRFIAPLVIVGALFAYSDAVDAREASNLQRWDRANSAAVAANQERSESAHRASVLQEQISQLQLEQWRRECTTPESWHVSNPTKYPTEMVGISGERVVIKRWSFKPADLAGFTVKLLCAK